ncbi:MAG: CcdB family protein [Allosphingosinicella sp.]
MARFDVYGLRGGGLVLDCQADLLNDLKTRFVVPLLPKAEAPRPADRLNPVFYFAGADFVMATQFAATVAVEELTDLLGSLRREEFAISNALDMLLTGY